MWVLRKNRFTIKTIYQSIKPSTATIIYKNCVFFSIYAIGDPRFVYSLQTLSCFCFRMSIKSDTAAITPILVATIITIVVATITLRFLLHGHTDAKGVAVIFVENSEISLVLDPIHTGAVIPDTWSRRRI